MADADAAAPGVVEAVLEEQYESLQAFGQDVQRLAVHQSKQVRAWACVRGSAVHVHMRLSVGVLTPSRRAQVSMVQSASGSTSRTYRCTHWLASRKKFEDAVRLCTL